MMGFSNNAVLIWMDFAKLYLLFAEFFLRPFLAMHMMAGCCKTVPCRTASIAP